MWPDAHTIAQILQGGTFAFIALVMLLGMKYPDKL